MPNNLQNIIFDYIKIKTVAHTWVSKGSDPLLNVFITFF